MLTNENQNGLEHYLILISGSLLSDQWNIGTDTKSLPSVYCDTILILVFHRPIYHQKHKVCIENLHLLFFVPCLFAV